MKIQLAFVLTAALISLPALARPVAHCIKSPTIECRPGFEIKEVNHCFTCVPSKESEEPVCVKYGESHGPVIECDIELGYRLGEDKDGCFHCVK